ncbi:reverse transcriptase domain-containing protein [Tanacetum coccineum]
MSKSAERAQMPANFVLRNTAGKGSKQATEGPQGFLLEDRLQEICEKHYNQICPPDRERLGQEESSSTCQRSPVSTTVFTMLGARDMNVFTRMREKKRDIYSQLGTKVASRHKHASNRIRASSGRLAKDPNHRRKEYGSATLKSQKDTRIPNYVKTYDGTRYPEDHLKIFQTAAKIKRWAMPTWCHIFNSILIGSAKVWFDKLIPESIDSYEVLRKAFLEFHTAKNTSRPVEITITRKGKGESTELSWRESKTEIIHVQWRTGMHENIRIMHASPI